MILDDKALPSFEPILASLYELAQHNGLSDLKKRGVDPKDLKNNPSVRRDFIRACHYGYDLAQRTIAKLVIEMDEDIRRRTSDLKAHRREKPSDAQDILRLIQIIRNRQVTLRRLIDSILYTMIRAQNWLFRRFTIDMRIHNIDPIVLHRTIQEAVVRNREERMKFNLVSDLSTVVQIGDLIEIDASATGEGKWKVIELKQGKMNEILSGLIAREKISGDAVSTAKNTFGDKAAKQTHRMTRQIRRVGELERIVETDKGLDPQYQLETLMTPDSIVLDNFYSEIEKVYLHAKKYGSGAVEINSCLRIFAINRDKTNNRAKATAAHQFFHMANRGRPCAFSADGSSTDRSEEGQMLSKVPYFEDIVDYNFSVPMADPIFAWPNDELIFDLVMGRVRVFVQFDYDSFFRFAKTHNVQIRWIRGKEADELKKVSMRLPGTDDAWGVLVELPTGDRFTLLAGFLARPYMNWTTPHQMLEMIKGFPAQLAKADPKKALESAI